MSTGYVKKCDQMDDEPEYVVDVEGVRVCETDDAAFAYHQARRARAYGRAIMRDRNGNTWEPDGDYGR
jgi:hypothetical protein